jgi:diaminopimelate decarboxylase
MINKPLSNVGGSLYIEKVSLNKLGKIYDTPLYVLSENRIRENFRRLEGAFRKNNKKHKILYSAKANTNINILKILREKGAYLDVVSIGEIFLGRKAGFKPDEILFTGTNVRNDELEFILESGVRINVDSLSQLNRLLMKGVPDNISVRINPQLGAGHHKHVITAGPSSKFGMTESQALKTYKTALQEGIQDFGIQMHIGSGILEPSPLLEALKKLLLIAGRIRDEVGIEFTFIDMGGGLGVTYKPTDIPLDVDTLAKRCIEIFNDRVKEFKLGEPELWMEPGRYLVADAGLLLTRVNTIKRTPRKTFAGVDAGLNILIRPAMYGSYHHILAVEKINQPRVEEYDVVGPICESGDFLARDRPLPKLEEGDLLAILTTGAYGMSMSSQYNSRPKPAEVLIKEDKHVLIRERQDLYDLLDNQIFKYHSGFSL